MFRVKFWGVRGSIPVSGAEFSAYGGNTSCIEMLCGDHRLIFDAGSGLREAGGGFAMKPLAISTCSSRIATTTTLSASPFSLRSSTGRPK